MKTLLTKLVFAITVLTASVFAQTPSFSFNVSPLQINATISVNVAGPQQIVWPVIVSLPPGTTGARLLQVYTPLDTLTNAPVTFAISNNGVTTAAPRPQALLQAGQSAVVTAYVDVAGFPVGTYNIPISILDYYSNYVQSVNLNLTVIDDRTYSFLPPTTKVVPHIATGAGWTTTLNYVNQSTSPSAIETRFYATDGTPRAFRLADGRITSVADVLVPAHGSTSITIADPTNQYTVTGSAEITPVLGASPVGVSIIYTTVPTDPKVTPNVASLPAGPSNTNTLTLFYDATNGNKAGLALLNSLNYPQPVTLQFYDSGGTPVATTSLVLGAKAQSAFVVSDQIPAIQGLSGVVVATTPYNALSGFVLRFDKNFQFIPILPF